MKKIVFISSIILSVSSFLFAQNDTTFISAFKNRDDSSAVFISKKESSSNIKMSYGSKGWVMNFDEKFLMRVQWRLQFRYESQSTTPLFFIPEEDAIDGSFNVQRARLKVGGFAYQPYIKYYLEYDFPSAYLLNWEFTFARLKYLQFKLGQWKIKYNTERFISSGKQQFVERSVSNRYFTFDRQMGVMLKGDLFDGKIASGSYNIGLFNGNGRMAQNDDGKFLFFSRYQWNFSRHPMKMSYCDIDRITKPEGFIALAYAHNQSAYTRFSSSGGGTLPGYVIGEGRQYNIHQYNVEAMFKYRGLSITNENHIKNIDDRELLQKSQIYGGYAMAGYFFSEIAKFVPKPLEVIVRYAYVSNNTFFSENINEYSLGLNWFFKGHLSKLTADFSYVENQDFVSNEDNFRFRIQWDVSF
jgi:hypothetical protein